MTVGLPALTTAALVNGLNPCGIGMMITFLGYLLVFGQIKKVRLRIMGGMYILSVFVTYLFLGLFFYTATFYLQRLWLAWVFKYAMGGLMFVAGLIQIKDFFWPDSPIHLRMFAIGREKIDRLMERSGLIMSVLVGVATTAFSTPCMLPLYIGTATVLASSGLSMGIILLYFLYYNFIFIAPLIIVLVFMDKGKDVIMIKEMDHKYGRWLRLLMGLVLVAMAYLIVK